VVNPLLHNINIVIGIWWAMIFAILLRGEYKRMCKVRVPKETIVGLVRSIISEHEKHNLCHVLWSVSVATLMEVGGPAIEGMLAQEALQSGLLGTVEKAIIVDAFQKRGLSFKTRRQRLVRDFFLSCSGLELTAVKNLVDGGGDVHNLFKMVYTDISSRKVRADIKGHLKAEATKLRSQCPGPHKREGIKVLSDIDDTLFSSGGHIGGCDKTFPHKKVYPGCLELFEVLDQTLHAELPSCNLVFLSARPHLYKSVMEEGSYRLFRSLVLDERRMHTFPTMLPGDRNYSVRGFLASLCLGTKGWRKVGEHKYVTFSNYAELYPEYDFVFFGDNGQGDLLAAQLMASGSRRHGGSQTTLPLDKNGQNEQPPNLIAALIHEVLPDEAKVLALEEFRDRGPAWRREQEEHKIFFHTSYVGAAIRLYESNTGLVTVEQLRYVAASAITDFGEDLMYHGTWQDQWRSYELKLRRDYDEAQRIVKRAGLEPLPAFPSVSTLTPRLAELAEISTSLSYEHQYEDTTETTDSDDESDTEDKESVLVPLRH